MVVGVEVLSNWRVGNGTDSYVVPFPTRRPFNIVNHGHGPFLYGHYGIHLGQEDRLTFLADKQRRVSVRLIDCRRSSPTFREYRELDVLADGSTTLVIPPGVAHTFDDLGAVVTINSYRLFLPSPRDWLDGTSDWDSENDIVNMPLDVDVNSIEGVSENSEPCSQLYYNLVASRQAAISKTWTWQHAVTEDVVLETGEAYRLKFREPATTKGETHDRNEADVTAILGVVWSTLRGIQTGPSSSILPQHSQRPFYVVDHGSSVYEHDAYGIHIGQEDNLIFVGPTFDKIQLSLLDCRANSPTFGFRSVLRFSANPERMLTIPPGVAHAFVFPIGVYTINQPRVFLGSDDKYEPQNDVIDLPINTSSLPRIRENHIPATDEYYDAFVSAQTNSMRSKANLQTPIVMLATDNSGDTFRVAIREAAEEDNSN